MFHPALNIHAKRAGRKPSWSPWVHLGRHSEMMGFCGSVNDPSALTGEVQTHSQPGETSPVPLQRWRLPAPELGKKLSTMALAEPRQVTVG